MKYWANINGVQHGPVEKQQLIGLGLTRDSYVWREGLEDWVMVQNFSELDDLFPVKPVAELPPTDDNTSTTAADEPLTEETPADKPLTEETPADETTTNVPVPPAIPQIPQIPQQPYQQTVAPQQPVPPCPPTNLVWGILTTVLCCQLLGIVSIIYALQVKSKYDSGDFATAQQYSDRAAMWSIAAIVVGLIITPFVMLVQLL